MNQPTPTAPGSAPAAPGAPPPAHVDRALADRCQSSGDYIAGLLAHGHLEAAGTPRKLPADLFPDHDPAVVQQVWDAALAVGYRAGQLSVRPTWTRDALDRLQAALNGAGYVAMGRLAARSAALHPPRHPADTEQPAQHDEDDAVVRDGGHW